MAQAGRSSAQALSPLHESLEKLDKGKATFRDIGRVWNNQQSILKNHTALMKTNMHVTHAAGQASQTAAVSSTAHGAAVVSTGLKLRFFNTLVHEGSRALVNWGKNTQWAGRQVTVGITVPLLLLARTATRVAEEYDAAMVRITKVTNFSVDDTTKAYDKQVAGLERRVDAMTRMAGMDFGFAPAESGGVMAEYAQMGFRGGLLDEMTEATLRLAYVSDSELPDAINLARVSLQAYGEDFRDINEVMARFNIIENNTSLSIAEIAQSLPTVASVAAQLNITAAETAGLIAMQKEAGIEASEAAQALRTGLIRLVQAPTDEASEAFERVNINLEKMQEENAGDTLGFLQDLGEQFNKVEPGTREMDQFIAAIGKLAGTRQAARLTAVLSEINNITTEGTVGFNAWRGATVDAADALAIYEAEYERLANSASGTAKRLGAAIQVELASIGQPILELMNSLRQFVLNILMWFNDLSDGTQKVILTFLGLIAAIGPVGMLMGITANAIGSVGKAVSSLLPRIVTLTSAQQVSKAVTDAKILSELQNARTMEASAIAAMELATAEERVAVARAQRGALGGIGERGRQAGKSLGSRTGGAGRWLASGGLLATSATRAAQAGGGSMLARAAGIAGGTATAVVASGLLLSFKSLVTEVDEFKKGFMELISGPVASLKETFEALKSTFSNMFDPLTQSGEVSEVFKTMSRFLGEFIGLLAGVGIGLFEVLLDIVEALANAFTVVVRLVQGLAALFSGEGAAAMDLFAEAGNQVMFMLRELAADIWDLFAGGPWKKFFNDRADELRRQNGLMQLQRDAADDARDSMRRHAEMVDESASAFQDARVNGDALIETLRAAGHTVEPARELVNSYDELDEIIESVGEGGEVNERVTNRILASIKSQVEAMFEAGILTQQQRDELMMQADVMDLQIQKQEILKNLETQRLLVNELIRKQAEADSLGDPSTIRSIEAQKAALAGMEEEYEDIIREMDALNAVTQLGQDSFEGLDDAMQDAEQSGSRLASALRGAMSSIQSEIGTAITDMLQAQSEALRESFQRRQEELREWAEDERERIEESAELERQRIEETHQAKIASLQEEEAQESELEAFRQYAFNQEKARLSYFSSRAAKQINLEVALARGELSQAAILREEIGADKSEYEAEKRRNEQSREAEIRSKARQEEIDGIEFRMDAQLEAVDAETEAVLEGLDEQLEAREEALEQEQEYAEAGLEARKKAIELTLREWQKVNPATEAEMERHLEQLKTDLNVSTGEWDQIVGTFSENTGTSIYDGFVNAFEDAQKQIAEDAKWEQVGRDIAEGIQEGFENAIDLEDAKLRSQARVATKRPGHESPAEFRPSPGRMHSGGPVSATGGAGLKPDETPIVAQSGEFMIQRDAAKVIGRDMLENLNNAHRYHSGGEISFKGNNNAYDVGRTLGQAFGHDGITPGYAGGTGAIGEALGMGKFSRGGSWPARQWAELAANTRAALNFWRSQGVFPGGIGTGVHRGDPKSDHSYGKALDYMVAPLGQYANREQRMQGWEVANWHVRNPGEFGTKNIIWNGLINSGSGWRPYTRYGDDPGPTLGHYDHVHVSYMHKGGAVDGLDPNQIKMKGGSPLMNLAANIGVRGFSSDLIQKNMPQLAQGGHINYDTVAKVHKGETVLTSRLSSELKDGIKNMNSGPVTIQIENFHGTDDNIEKLATRLEGVFKQRDKNRGRKRVMN